MKIKIIIYYGSNGNQIHADTIPFLYYIVT